MAYSVWVGLPQRAPCNTLDQILGVAHSEVRGRLRVQCELHHPHHDRVTEVTSWYVLQAITYLHYCCPLVLFQSRMWSQEYIVSWGGSWHQCCGIFMHEAS